ncbi:MAG: efflux RND transporter permease subunit [Anaerolineae bacterium]|nr:efflux RND transporter permease subunit [Anaerolineae bacterium]
MRAIFNLITTLSLRFKWITVSVTLALVALGYYAFTQLNQELLPDIEFPQTFIIARNNGASSDQILTMYSIPIEERAQEVSGVVNVETTSNNGIGFAIVRNEFGLVQEDMVSELQNQLDEIVLPVRHVLPPSGENADDLLNALSPEAIHWLYYWALQEDSGFTAQLTREAWDALSDDALGALPEAAFSGLDQELRQALLERAVAPSMPLEPIEDVFAVAPPALPENWQASDPRMTDVTDLTEFASYRNLASVFNDLISSQELVGPWAPLRT